VSEFLEWVERAATENLRGRRENAEQLIKEGTTVLTLLLAGATGGLAYTLKALESTVWVLALGAAAFSAYLYVLCVVLILTVVRAQDLPPLFNEPENLYQKQYPLRKIREAELKNVQARITQTTKRNVRTAKWLNRIRLAAAMSPLAFVLATSGAAVGLPCVPAPAEEHRVPVDSIQTSWLTEKLVCQISAYQKAAASK
jgi:hypothetical protein